MAFSSASRSVKLYFAGDATQLDRTLSRTEARLKRFERVAGKGSTLNSGLVGSFSKGGAIAAGLGLAVLGLKNVTDAARNAEVILGQTSVAVEDAGLSWAKYGDQVQAAAMRISKSSSFDDEAVLQSFALFVRGQKDVAKSLELASLAANVARGRYTDLESATMLVNKAAMGQIGALRRAGIQIDRNATATQALTALQQSYGNAAEKYSRSAAGANDRLAVSFENIRERAGESLSKALGEGENKLADFADGTEKAKTHVESLTDKLLVLRDALHLPGITFGGSKDLRVPDVTAGAAAFNNQFGLGALKAAGEGNRKGFKVGAANGPTTGVSSGLRNDELNARLGGNRNTIKGVLAKEATYLQNEIKNSLPEDQVALKEALLGVTDEIKSIDDQIIADANDKKQAAADAAAKAKTDAADRKAKIKAALMAQAQAFKDQADAIKSAVLGSFDTKSQKIDNNRALQDAKEALRQANILGDPNNRKQALRDLQDANRAITRQRLEQQTFTVTQGPKGPVDTLKVGNIVININSNQSASKIVDEVITRINKKTRTSAGQSRGRQPGFRPF